MERIHPLERPRCVSTDATCADRLDCDASLHCGDQIGAGLDPFLIRPLLRVCRADPALRLDLGGWFRCFASTVNEYDYTSDHHDDYKRDDRFDHVLLLFFCDEPHVTVVEFQRI